jgi:glycine/D-amino acid oxidase-like deaminating enzyme
VKRAIVIGAGVQGLLIAKELCEAGMGVEIFSAGEDPRRKLDAILKDQTPSLRYAEEADRSQENPGLRSTSDTGVGGNQMVLKQLSGDTRSATCGGEAGRSITLLEGCNSWSELSGPAFDWQIRTTRRAMELWRELFANDRDLFEGTSLHTDSILRLFGGAGELEGAAKLLRSLDARCDVLGVGELTTVAPCLVEACGRGTVSGALRIEGFSLNILRFVGNLLDWLERRGARLRWNWECREVVSDSSGEVEGVRFEAAKPQANQASRSSRVGFEQADHYVVAPGAYCGAGLLDQLGIELHGVAGRWLLMPQPQGFSVPLKMRCAESQINLNFVPYFDSGRGREYVSVSGGYIEAGEFPFACDPAEIAKVDAALERAARRVLPGGEIERSDAICMRSATNDHRPAVAIRGTAAGGFFVFHSGLNTGTAAMAPAIARAISELLSEKEGLDVIQPRLEPTGIEPATSELQTRRSPN